MLHKIRSLVVVILKEILGGGKGDLVLLEQHEGDKTGLALQGCQMATKREKEVGEKPRKQHAGGSGKEEWVSWEQR